MQLCYGEPALVKDSCRSKELPYPLKMNVRLSNFVPYPAARPIITSGL